jgi:hypothetical protein
MIKRHLTTIVDGERLTDADAKAVADKAALLASSACCG